MKGTYWCIFVWISTVSVMFFIIDTMKDSVHLYLNDVPEEGCSFIALGMYCVSLFGALSLMCCNEKELSIKERLIMGIVGISIVILVGVSLCMPICAHAFIYKNVGTLYNNVYYFWVANYNSDNPEFIRWCMVTILLFLASYIGCRLIFNQLKSHFIN